tara:strand:- start:311 stop:481 length:171 start_codon:yes stop_codon:yes gene_type:complete
VKLLSIYRALVFKFSDQVAVVVVMLQVLLYQKIMVAAEVVVFLEQVKVVQVLQHKD